MDIFIPLMLAATESGLPVPDLKDATELIESNGIETVLSAVVVVTIMAGIGLLIWWARRRLSGDYVRKDAAVAYVKKHHPKLIKPSIGELADLRDHDAFDMWNRELRLSDTLQVRTADGSIDVVQTRIAKDLIRWNIRANRNLFKRMLDEAYLHVPKDPTNFEEYFGDSKGFGHKVNQAFTDVKSAVAMKLKTDLRMPVIVYDSFEEHRSEVHETMRDMLQIAIANHTNNYWRMHEVLNSQYAFTRTFRFSVLNYLRCCDIDFSKITYEGDATSSALSMSTSMSIGELSGTRNVTNIFDYE